MNPKRLWLGDVVMLLSLFGCGVAVGAVFSDQVLFAFTTPAGISASDLPRFRLVGEAWNVIDRYYVDRAAVKPRAMAYGAVAGMVDALGDTGHTTFLTPEMVKESMGQLKGSFQGIGAELQVKDGRVTIVAPLDDSPAQRAGIRPGEVITAVDGKSVAGSSLEEVVRKILGPAGTQVTLSLATRSGVVREVTLTRARIKLHNVTWHALPGTRLAHLRIASFSEGVTKDLQAALGKIREKDLSGVVLDLRNDPGGSLDEAVGAASQFLTTGNVLLEKDAQGKSAPVPVVHGGLAPDLPLVVLINRGTASAAEIVAGALRDAHRATLVGETTFGTGTVLRSFNLSDGSAILLATREWLTPNGDTLWHEGIKPQIAVAIADDVALLSPETESGLTAAKLRATPDRQLLAAISHLAPDDASPRPIRGPM